MITAGDCQNPGGTRSHKQEDGEVQQLYADPLITDRDNYTDFIGYFEMSPLNTMAQQEEI